MAIRYQSTEPFEKARKQRTEKEVAKAKKKFIKQIAKDVENMKSSRFDIRIGPDLRDEFTKACENNGKTASEVIRQFMQDYIAKET